MSEVLTLLEAAEDPVFELMKLYCDNNPTAEEIKRREGVLLEWIAKHEPAPKPRSMALRHVHQRKRKAAEKQATPPWVDLWLMERMYLKAHSKTQRTGIKHVVDHIIPLQSPLVCGLHVHTNMQVITERQNAKKSNRWSPRWNNV